MPAPSPWKSSEQSSVGNPYDKVFAALLTMMLDPRLLSPELLRGQGPKLHKTQKQAEAATAI
jgi:hypothetical protein